MLYFQRQFMEWRTPSSKKQRMTNPVDKRPPKDVVFQKPADLPVRAESKRSALSRLTEPNNKKNKFMNGIADDVDFKMPNTSNFTKKQ